jgi:hypothetical protein
MCPSFLTHNVVTSLRSTGRKCSVRLKMQVLKRQVRSVEHERAEALARAEENRADAETKYAAREADAARVDANQWIETKEG